MKRTAQIALALALLTLAVGCHRDTKEAQLKALDEAYKSGVFTKEEYDSKKQAMLGTSAAPTPAPTSTAPAPAGAVDTPANPPAAAAQPVADVPPPQPVQAAAPPIEQTPAPAPARKAPARIAQVQSVPPPVPAGAAPAQPAPAPAQSNTPPPRPPQVPAAPPTAAETAEPEPAPLAGCQDAESRAGGPNGAQERFFVASEDAVRQAAIQAFANLDFTVHSSTAHDMEASKKRHLSAVIGAGGERVILHFSSAKKNGQVGTRLVGETKKTFTGRLAQKSWTTAVLAQIGCNLRGGR